MAKLIYAGITSLDGYVNDADGNFDWSVPSEEVHAFVNDLERSIGTYLYGRRMYEVMSIWETMDLSAEPAVMKDYASIWRDADKIVFSTTLDAASTSRTRLLRIFDPASIRELKATADRDISVSGPGLATHAIEAGLVDEFHLFLTPAIVGGGTRFLPDDMIMPLELLDQHTFDNGVVHLHYRRA
jgi:dihydrofolate reductase